MTTVLWLSVGWVTWQWPGIITFLSRGRITEISDWALLSFVLTAVILTRLALSPYFVFREIQAERDSIQADLEGKIRELVDLRSEAVDECFEKVTGILKEEAVFPFNALSKARGHTLTNVMVMAVCDRLIASGYAHPFAGLEGYVLESEYRAFLEYVRHHADNTFINPEDGHAYLAAAERWREKQGHPQPPPEQSLTMTTEKTNIKGLKLSIDRPEIHNFDEVISGVSSSIWELSARLTFVNDGKVPRSILGIEFICCEPTHESLKVYYSSKARQFAEEKKNELPITIPPDASEVIASFGTVLTPEMVEMVEKPGTEVGVMITASDGKGGLPIQNRIMMITVEQRERSRIFHGECPRNILLG